MIQDVSVYGCLYFQAMETLIRLMEMNINALGSNAREDQVWDSMLTVRAVVAESKKRKLVGSFVTT